MSADFAPWQQRAWRQAMDAHAAGRLPHALLVCGPSRMGKRALAEALAQRLLCTGAHGADRACGACHACRMFAARAQRDPPETRPDGSPSHPHGHPGHPDARYVGYVLNEKSSPKRMYQELVIEQIRDLAAWMVLSPLSDAGKVALIEPAHAMNHAAANALLKTLEEPVPLRVILLVSDQVHRLPATIRSRCQRLELRPPAREEARAWLVAGGATAAQADEALDANLGHPGLARRDLGEGGLARRLALAKDLAALATGRERPVAVALRWGEDDPALWLRLAAEALRELLSSRARGAETARLQRAGVPAASPLALAGWFDECNRVHALLRTTLRQDLLLVELLRQWRDVFVAPARFQPAAARR